MGRVARALPLTCAVLLAALIAVASLALPASAQSRFAVVVGAERYSDAIGLERGARTDARLVSEALEEEGFEVELVEDPDEATLKRSAFALVDRLNGAGDGSVGVFYFVGAGMQLNADTFLLPVDARTIDDLTLSGSALSAKQLSERLNTVAGATTVIVVDAASPSPLTARFDLRPGLAAIDPTDDGLVIFSHYPDQVAVPRQDGASVFARAFAGLVHDVQPNFDDALTDMRVFVDDESGGSRYAWITGRLNPTFTLSARDQEFAAADDGPAAEPSEIFSGGAPSAPAPEPEAAPDLTPTPVPARSADESDEASASEVAPEQIHMVEVFFGTDRAVLMNEGAPEFGDASADALTFGVAEVSIPPKHVTGQLESPAWWRFEFSPDPEKHVVYHGASVRSEDAFFDEVRAIVEESAQRQAFVFIHGFNTSFENAARRTAQMHHDLAFDGAPIFYAWPSEGSTSPLAYAHDGNAADRTAPHLQEFLTLVAERTGAEKIHLIAHSMGNRALLSALDEMAEAMARDGTTAPFNQIILSAPDIDAEVFENIASQILPTAERVTLYASANDEALKLSREFNGAPRAGDSSQGIVIVSGLNTIDASDVRTELFDIGHDYYADDDSILHDMSELMATNAEPTDRGLEERLRPPGSEEYWVILRGMLAGR